MMRCLALVLMLLSLACAATDETGSGGADRFCIVYAPGPSWDVNRSAAEQVGIEAHVAHYDSWQTGGKLALGGPFTQSNRGGLMVPVRSVTRAEAEAYARQDPAVLSGLLVFELQTWHATQPIQPTEPLEMPQR